MARKASPVAERLYGPLTRGFGRRVAEAAQRIGSKADASRAMGLSTDQLDNIVGEDSVPNFVSIMALAEKSGVSIYWIAFAREPVHILGSFSSTGKFFSEGEEEVVWINRLDNQGAFPFSGEWLARTLDRKPGDLAALSAPGDAMEPTIGRDDLLLIDITQRRITDGEVFVLDFGGSRVVRRTQRAPDGSFRIVADNPKYNAMVLSAEEATGAEISGRVVWAGGRV